tara:strand:+ start:1129 stop:2067 length:939 start_codon:yes stop_codon:yes gene_type:complete
MRSGASISALLHTVVIILIVVGLPDILKSERQPLVAIAVEVVTPEALKKERVKKAPPKPAPKKSPPKTQQPKAVKKPPPPLEPPKQQAKLVEPAPRPVEKPKPEQRAEPVPVPKPKPKPKPVVKKSEPKPQLKPKPPAETTVAAKSPPAPRPKRKPKPPPDEFQSLLKNLAKEKKQRKAEPEKKPEKIARKSPPTPKRSALQERMIAQGLVQAINSQVTPCWKIQAGAKDAANIRVAVNIRLNPDGSLGRQPRVQDAARMREGVDDFFRAVAESALRALRDPACMPLKLPYEHYDIWKEISFVFDPREALGQ